MWKSLFEAITAAFGFFGSLLRKSPPAEEPVDAAAARAGTAAGHHTDCDLPGNRPGGATLGPG
jgi:hypothetical protein